jgi:hypothetical protein
MVKEPVKSSDSFTTPNASPDITSPHAAFAEQLFPTAHLSDSTMAVNCRVPRRLSSESLHVHDQIPINYPLLVLNHYPFSKLLVGSII